MRVYLRRMVYATAGICSNFIVPARRTVPCARSTADAFYTYNGDIQSVGDYIRLYLNRYHRWGSPKYLAGESYGTTRAVGLCKYLYETHTIPLNGLMLISSVNNFNLLEFSTGNDLTNALYLPTYAANAWYHGR